MENIRIYDNFLTNDEINECNKILNDDKWKFGHKSNSYSVYTPFWIMELTSNIYFSETLKTKIEKICNKKLILTRVYANGQCFGQDGCFHQDADANDLTFCLYLTNLNAELIDNIGGDIIFKIPDNQNIKLCINSYYNRGILFPANYYHKGMSYNRYFNGLRICIAWKFKSS